MQLNAFRIKVLQAQADLVNSMKEAAGKELQRGSKDHHEYNRLLKDLIVQGFAIGSAALVSLALFGAFVSRAAISTVDVLTPKVFTGLRVGAMLPYWSQP